MNKLVRSLLSGASLATLQLCAIGNAARATTINGPRGAYTNPAGSTTGNILVTSTGDITGDLTNEGTVGPASIGIQVQGTISGSLVNAKTGVINANRYGILVTGTMASIAGGIENAGKILVATSATNGTHVASAIGYNANAGGKITNTGSMNVNVQVIGTEADRATAKAFGVYEYGSASFGAGLSHSVSNSGSISLTAAAVATSDSAIARARAEMALDQGAFNADSLEATLTNTGDLSLSAAAKAVATTSRALAEARAEQAIRQSVGNQTGHAGDSISLAVTNSGSLALTAVATAQGETRAKAYAYAEEAVTQYAYNAGEIVESISNSGSLKLTAGAKATGVTTFAKVAATAWATEALHQSAYNNLNSAVSLGASVVQTITNSGDLTVSLNALAKRTVHATTAQDCCGIEVIARAEGLAFFVQSAVNVDSIAQSLTNSGVVKIDSIAKASASTAYARVLAEAQVFGIFRQHASNHTNTAIARAETVGQAITNSGDITISLDAQAQRGGQTVPVHGTQVGAHAVADGLFEQQAFNADTITQSLTNSGAIEIGGSAKVAGATVFAQVSANARVSGIFHQDASNHTSTSISRGVSIAQTVTNSGHLTISLDALAKRPGQTVSASQCCTEVHGRASVEDVFHQNAFNADTITQSLTNSGVIKIEAEATATGVYQITNAKAAVERIFEQDAGNSNSATLSITNSTPILIALTAVAKGASPEADASASQLFFQNVGSSGAVSEKITNSGDISIVMAATAVGGSFPRSHDASASARQDTAFKQRASNNDSVIQSLTNSGSLHFDLSAKATGLHEVFATAEADGFKQEANNTASISQAMTNTGTLAFALNATALSPSADDRVDATAELGSAFKQFARVSGSAAGSATADMTLTNSGTVSLTAFAKAKGGTEAEVSAEANVIEQFGEGMGTLTALVNNSGSISVANFAQATNNSLADASVYIRGISQDANSVTKASLSVTNSGTVNLQGTADALATSRAFADAFVRGVGQTARQFDSSLSPASATLSVSNSGTIHLAANAKATFGIEGRVIAAAIGVEQRIEEVSGVAALKNTGTIQVAAIATGLPGTPGAGVTSTSARLPSVHAEAYGLSVLATGEVFLKQNIFNGSVTYSHAFDAPAPTVLAVSNSGTISIAATANGAAFDAANISAVANGMAVVATSERANGLSRVGFNGGSTRISHTENDGGTLSGAISNSGSLLVSASAPGGIATANGIVITADENDVAVTNAKGGVISVEASGAVISAAGILENSFFRFQNSTDIHHSGTYTNRRTQSDLSVPAGDVSGSITNSGTINVSVSSTGDYIGDGEFSGEGPEVEGGIPPARITGILADGIAVNAVNMSADILNTGAINVAAQGLAAIANGIRVFASQTGIQGVEVSSRFHVTSVTSFQSATQTELNHLHTALGNNTITGKITNTGTLNVSATGAAAVAKGIDIEADTLNGAIVNSGAIKVSAIGTGANAEGIVIVANTLGSHASFQNNGGTISATLNGKRGTAIDVSNAPSTLVLGLNGGSIYGNIVENEAGNAISVGSGNLLLDGLINPSKAKLGSLTVGANGKLTLANNAAEGNATAYVNSFVQNGTLAIVGGTDGSSGSIHAANATLAGGAVVDLNLRGGVYGTNTTYKVVFSDADLSGTWSSVAAASAKTFFSASGAYTDNEADITLTRATFDSIAGLTDNEKAVGAAIETIYESGGLSGPLGSLVGALFNLTPQQYAGVLEALSGEPAGELTAADQAAVQSFLDAINNHMSGTTGGDGDVASLTSGSQVLAANAAPSNVTPAQASNLSGTHVWGGGFQSGNSVDRTASGPAYKSHQGGLLAGVDVPLAPNVIVGIAGSYGTGDLQTEQQLGFGTFSAAQVAGYGRFVADNGIYAMGDVSYGDFTNKLSRYIAVPGFGSGNVHGKFDSHAWGLYGEAGWKLNPSDWAMSVTPYAAVSYLDAKSDGYTETGTFGVPLTIGGSSSRATSSYLGLKLETDWTWTTVTVTPRLTAAWQHDFTKNAWEMSAAFAAVPTVGFGLDGSDLARDGAYVDGGITLHAADTVDILLDYQGRFTSDRTDNTFLARANIKF